MVSDVTAAQLLHAAIAASGLPISVFATDVLGLAHPSTVFRWLAGSGTVHPTVAVVSAAIVADPALAELLRGARASL